MKARRYELTDKEWELVRPLIPISHKDLLENGRIREDTKAKKPGLSSTTVHGIHVMLKSALKRAVQERLIPFNPAEFCIPPKITKPELQVIPSERYQSYLTAAEQRGVLPMFYLELATGLRKGEIAALLWSDFDAQTKTIHVTKQYLFYNGQGLYPRRNRTVPSDTFRSRMKRPDCWNRNTRSTRIIPICSRPR